MLSNTGSAPNYRLENSLHRQSAAVDLDEDAAVVAGAPFVGRVQGTDGDLVVESA